MSQCHRCKFNGKGSDECLKCSSANYLYNDHKTITPVDDVSKVQGKIEPAYLHSSESSLKGNGDLIEYKDKNTKRNLEDCENVLKVLKGCHQTSLKYIAIILSILMSVGNNLPMLEAVLDGKNLIEYANETGTSKQNAYQTWNRLMKENPIILQISDEKKKRKMKKRIELN